MEEVEFVKSQFATSRTQMLIRHAADGNKGDDTMIKYEIIATITEKNNGYLMISAVQKVENSRTYLSKYVKNWEMKQIESGICIHPEIGQICFVFYNLKIRELFF